VTKQRRRLGVAKRAGDSLLVLPFAWIGLVGAWIVAGFFGPQPTEEVTFRAILLCATPLVAGALGWALGSFRPGGLRVFALVLGAPVAGALNGAVMGTLAAALQAYRDASAFVVGGCLLGAALGLAFLPGLAPALWAAHRARRAREGSVLRRVDERGPFLLAAATGALALWLFLDRVGRGPFTRTLVVAALIAGLVVLLRDAMDLARVRAETRRNAIPVDSHRASMSGATAASFDFGVGSEASEVLVPAGAAYRDAPRRVALIVGDAPLARRKLAFAISRDAFVIGAALVAAVRL
jgi:hypothetical protein